MRRRPRARPWWLGALALALPLACGDGAAPTLIIGDACTLNSDCAAPDVCLFSKCHTPCAADRDCGAARCVRTPADGEVCQLSTERTCKRSSDCVEGQICAVDLQCRNACQIDRDCVGGAVCADGACAKPDEVQPGGHLPHHGGGEDDGCSFNSDCAPPLICRDATCLIPCRVDVDCGFDEYCTGEGVCHVTEEICVPAQQISCGDDCGVQTCVNGRKWDRAGCHGCGVGGAGGAGGAGVGGAGGSGGASTSSAATSSSSSSGPTTSSSSSSTTSSSASAGGATTSTASSSSSTASAGGATTTTTSSTTTTGPGGGVGPTSAQSSTSTVGGGGFGAASPATTTVTTTSSSAGGSTAASGAGCVNCIIPSGTLPCCM